MNIFDITLERRLLMQEIEEADGELTEELADRMAINRSDFEEKSEAYVIMIARFDSEIEMGKAEIQRIQSFIERKQKAKDRLETNLLYALKEYGSKDPKKDIWRAEAGTYLLSTRTSPKVVEVVNTDNIPADYKFQPSYTIPPLAPDKKKIKEALEAGEIIEGAQLKDGKVSLVIK